MEISRILQKYGLLSRLVLGTILLVTNGATATEAELVAQATPPQIPDPSTADGTFLEPINRYNSDSSSDPMAQITNVWRLRDISPGDWADRALRNLVERYGCLAGYPDGTYRGKRALTRYELAAGLNACLQQMELLIAESEAVARSEIQKLQRLAQEFEAELATLATGVDNLEGRVAFLEDHQFSTTTKLDGEVIFGLASILTGDDADGNQAPQVPVLGNRTRLYLETSFTGEDYLIAGLATGNMPFFSEVTGTLETELSFAQDFDNDLIVEWLVYGFPLGDRTQVLIEAFGGFADDFVDPVNFLYGDGSSGSVSLFGNLNPIYNQVFGSGLALTHQLSDQLELSLGYLADSLSASDPSPGSGLFNGPYSGLAQVVFRPSDRFNLGLAYIHSYNQSDTFTGSRLSNFRLFTEEEFGEAVPTSSNSYGINLSWQISDRFVLGSWAGYTNTRTLSTLGGQINRGYLDIWNWAVTLAFPDLGKEGNLGGLIVGIQPKVTNSNIELPSGLAEDRDTSLYLEAFYQHQLTDKIAISPGVIWLTAPDHNSDNEAIMMGVVRTTFSF